LISNQSGNSLQKNNGYNLMAAFVRMLVIGIVDMLMDVILAIMLVGMFMFIISVTAHFSFTSPRIYLAYFSSIHYKAIQL
jgi:hypothetical protein